MSLRVMSGVLGKSQDLPFTPEARGICSSVAIDLAITVGPPQLVAMTILCLEEKSHAATVEVSVVVFTTTFLWLSGRCWVSLKSH